MLQTFTVAAGTLELIKDLQKIIEFSNLRLVGGTALSLYLGHRNSIDIDLFGTHNLSSEDIVELLKERGWKIELINKTKNIITLFCNQIKVDIVQYNFPWLDELIEEEGIRLASKKDIAAMKLYAITGRGTKKDFIDLYYLLQEYTLEEMIGFFKEKYKEISLFMVVKSLGYFEDAENYEMPKMYTNVSWEEIKDKIKSELKRLSDLPPTTI